MRLAVLDPPSGHGRCICGVRIRFVPREPQCGQSCDHFVVSPPVRIPHQTLARLGRELAVDVGREVVGDEVLDTEVHRFDLLRDRLLRYRLSRSEEHTSELQSLMRISYAVFCLKKKKQNKTRKIN